MTHSLRVLSSIGGLLALTVLATWLLASRLVLRPLLDALSQERVGTALYVAREVENAPDPAARAWELARELNLELQPVRRAPDPGGRYERIAQAERELWLGRRPRAPAYVPLQGVPGVWGMSIRWPVDIRRPWLRVAWGFGIIAFTVLLGMLFATRWALAPLRATSGAMDRVAAGALDVRVPEGRDAAGRMAASFNRMAERVSALVNGQRRLMAGISHELRTPLARMRLVSELLRDEGASAKRLDTLDRNVGSMDDLIGELLESARLEEGVLVLQREPIALAPLLHEAVEAAELGERPVQLQADEALQVQADRVRLRRVLDNLLSNARRYTPADAALRILASRHGELLRITVADRGPGVPPEDLPHLFDPFYRTEESRSRRTGGLGLGLMLVRQIVEAHGGRVSARSREEGGLEVILELPASP